MAGAMIDPAASAVSNPSVETVLRDELAQGDALISSIAPILRHLLANDDHSIFSDEILACARGMMGDIAAQLLDELRRAGGDSERGGHDAAQIEPLVASFIAQPAFLAHVHALALEWQLTVRLQSRLALDPVLSPLLQALVASPETGTATTAMAFLAAQARFTQSLRRMELPLHELPGDLLHAALLAMRHMAGADDDHAASAEAAIRARYDESRSRLGLIARLVTGMGGGATAALAVTHAGVAMFLSALALAAGQDRDLAVLATNEAQRARLALALRAGGLKSAAIEEQFFALHPDIALPNGLAQLGADRAAAVLATSSVYPGS